MKLFSLFRKKETPFQNIITNKAANILARKMASTISANERQLNQLSEAYCKIDNKKIPCNYTEETEIDNRYSFTYAFIPFALQLFKDIEEGKIQLNLGTYTNTPPLCKHKEIGDDGICFGCGAAVRIHAN